MADVMVDEAAVNQGAAAQADDGVTHQVFTIEAFRALLGVLRDAAPEMKYRHIVAIDEILSKGSAPLKMADQATPAPQVETAPAPAAISSKGRPNRSRRRVN